MNLVAVIPVLYRGKQFNAGEILPADNEDMNAAWLGAGSAKWIGKEVENKQDSDHEKAENVKHEAEEPVKKKTSKAKQAAALAGNTGEAVNSTTEINQVGRIPEAEGRKK